MHAIGKFDHCPPRARLKLLAPETATDRSADFYHGPVMERLLRAALQRHHDHLMGQTETDEHGIVPAEAYQESTMCEETMRLLAMPDTAWASIPPNLLARTKEMQFSVAYNADLEASRSRLGRLLMDVRQAVASVLPIGAGLPLYKLRKLRDTVFETAADLGKCAESLSGDERRKFARRAAACSRVVEMMDEILAPAGGERP